jgi:hypothetical protein
MNAQEIYKVASSNFHKFFSEELNREMEGTKEAIKKAADEGRFSITLSTTKYVYMTEKPLTEWLRTLGFKVRHRENQIIIEWYAK